ncbi:MAG: hypothetical protein A3J46_05345 [Candidatus Yanofskybacteria bacterium RIFCSPHIGHO2_02_FULL_41_11]|uniref:PseI/NeuA/B-like domain-containing protein n=1 Tax=Candidatus Yanofskybacteria bacterium RIFCSPHIGHO2_02_FULL_41_11 TaxID=1802675 RepID=A0A1F8FBR6_9BACT|nr:MAG: hypothetical protein A3J46_05345 [Candidatus Yanofskybacteria bacterium RIFCSPHIGHO2_02_FULL_41_11]
MFNRKFAKIIVEICQNHNGDRGILRDLIYSAKENGADVIKGQMIFSEDLTRRKRFDQGLVEDNGTIRVIKRPFDAEFNRLKLLDLSQEDYVFFVEEAKKVGIIPMLTVFSRKRIQFAASLPWKEKMIKVASYDCGSYSMINELADCFDNLIISTGASFDEEISGAAEILKNRNKQFSFLHCVTSYPNTLEMANLARMDWLRQFTPSVGWSDHTLVNQDDIKAAKVAIMLGADYIERHFTILSADKTKDGPVSITPSLLKELFVFKGLPEEEQRRIVEKTIPKWQIMIGRAKRKLTSVELLNRDFYRGRFASFVNGRWVYNWEEINL